MANLKIHIYGDPVLREKCAPVEAWTDADKKLIEDMAETMYSAQGIGLAAPQVGVTRNILIIDVDWSREEKDGEKPKPNLRVFVNAELLSSSDDDVPFEEGCLSIPGVRGEVYRPSKVRVRARDIHYEAFEIEADGLLARCFQHEFDHINGVLFPDRMTFVKRALIAGQLNRLRKGLAAEEMAEAQESSM
ncbi:MAG: peptide deformylase [bacterium]